MPDQRVPTAAIERLSQCPCCGRSVTTHREAPASWTGNGYFDGFRGELGISQCGGCGLVFVNPRPAEPVLVEYYQQPEYDCHWDSYAEEDRLDAHMRLSLIERVSRPGSLIDFGCGAGSLLAAARERGWSPCAGVELGAEVRERLNQRGYSIFPDLPSAVQDIGPPSVLTMIHVLEHIVDLRGLVRQIHATLLPGALFVVEVPNASSLRGRIADSFLNALVPNPGQRLQAYPIHLYYFTAHSLARLLESGGFSVVSIRTVGMGVEELLRVPASRPVDAPASGPAAQTEQRRSSALKRAVKAFISTSRLGENVLMICRRS